MGTSKMSQNDRRRKFWQEAKDEQLAWLSEHGGCREGYRDFYGRYGRSTEEADAIFEADHNYLEHIERQAAINK